VQYSLKKQKARNLKHYMSTFARPTHTLKLTRTHNVFNKKFPEVIFPNISHKTEGREKEDRGNMRIRYTRADMTREERTRLKERTWKGKIGNNKNDGTQEEK
jgi:hypothetical protein